MTHSINLYDPTLLRHRHWLTAGNLLVAVGLVFAVMLGWGAWLRIQAGDLAADAEALDGSLKTARDESVALGARLADRRADPKLELDLAAMKELLGARQEVLVALGQGAAAKTTGYADYLRGLARQSVANLWLTGFSVGPEGARMEIRGRTLDPAQLPEYIRRLNAEPAFRGQRFAALSVIEPPSTTSSAPNASATPGAAAAVAAPPPWLEFALVPEAETKPAGGAR